MSAASGQDGEDGGQARNAAAAADATKPNLDVSQSKLFLIDSFYALYRPTNCAHSY